MEPTNLFKQAAQELTNETKDKSTYRLIPGDPIKGTLYKGFISRVEIKIIDKKDSPNHGRHMLVIRTQVTSGEYKGMEDIFNRVLQPSTLDEPTALQWKDETSKEMDRLKKQEKPPVLIDEREARKTVELNWQKRVVNHLKLTLQQLQFIGVDISSQDEKEIYALAAHRRGKPVVWKVYDEDKKSGKPRRIFLEDVKNHFDKKNINDEGNNAPDLFEQLPGSNMFPML